MSADLVARLKEHFRTHRALAGPHQNGHMSARSGVGYGPLGLRESG